MTTISAKYDNCDKHQINYYEYNNEMKSRLMLSAVHEIYDLHRKYDHILKGPFNKNYVLKILSYFYHMAN